jgi:glycosyltransferase involved in cell wall biosynthesis
MVLPAWHILTGEYPPTAGGVSDYSRSIAQGLAAANEEVHVWAPSLGGDLVEDAGVQVHRLPQGYGLSGLRTLSRALGRERLPRRLLVQYVPHAFGLSGVNVPFCAWLSSLRGTEIYVMFHEVAVPWTTPRRWKQNAAAGAMRLMAALLLARADRIFVSTSSWEPYLRRLTIRWKGATWLPVPSNLPVSVPEDARLATRRRLGVNDDSPIIGHFGTYGPLSAPLLAPALLRVLEADPRRVALLVGRGSEAFAKQLRGTQLPPQRVLATGALEDTSDVATHLLSCDILLQVYPDGVSTRRTTTMAGLALGIPIATNAGHLTESLWHETGIVEIVSKPGRVESAAERLLADPRRAALLGKRGRDFYEQYFCLERAVDSLRTPPNSEPFWASRRPMSPQC